MGKLGTGSIYNILIVDIPCDDEKCNVITI